MRDPKRRDAIQPLIDTMMKYIGICGSVHLYGWGSSKTYGDWGDYDHYDETVGGREYFRDNIRRVHKPVLRVKHVAGATYRDA